MFEDPNRCQPLADCTRGLAIDAVETASHGYPGAAMGMADESIQSVIHFDK